MGNSVTIAGKDIECSTSLCNLSFYFDNNLKGSPFLNRLWGTAYSPLHCNIKINHSMDTASTKILIHALILSWLHYCNSLLVDLPNMKWINFYRSRTWAAILFSNSACQTISAYILDSVIILKFNNYVVVAYIIDYVFIRLVKQRMRLTTSSQPSLVFSLLTQCSTV